MAIAKKISDKAESTTVVPTTVKERDESIKYRCDFNSYEEYNKYTGKKG